jgi:hypothetical protein
VHSVSDVRQKRIHTAELLEPNLSLSRLTFLIVKLRKYKSPGSDHIPAELIQAGGKTILPVIHEIINSIHG